MGAVWTKGRAGSTGSVAHCAVNGQPRCAGGVIGEISFGSARVGAVLVVAFFISFATQNVPTKFGTKVNIEEFRDQLNARCGWARTETSTGVDFIVGRFIHFRK